MIWVVFHVEGLVHYEHTFGHFTQSFVDVFINDMLLCHFAPETQIHANTLEYPRIPPEYPSREPPNTL